MKGSRQRDRRPLDIVFELRDRLGAGHRGCSGLVYLSRHFGLLFSIARAVGLRFTALESPALNHGNNFVSGARRSASPITDVLSVFLASGIGYHGTHHLL